MVLQKRCTCDAQQDNVPAAHFYAGGAMDLVYWWLEEGMPLGEEELTETFARLLPSGNSGERE